MTESIKKFFVGGLFVVSLSTYALYLRNSVPATATTAAATSTQESSAVPVLSSDTDLMNGASLPTGKYRDGTYTGKRTDAYYGYIKISLTVSGGKMTGISFVEYPSDEAESRRINQEAIPILTEEALTSQDATGIHGTTRSSQTTEAFILSLQSALDKAKT